MKKIIHGDFNFFLKPCYNSSIVVEKINTYFFAKRDLQKMWLQQSIKKSSPSAFFGIQAIHLFYYNQNHA